MRSRSLSVEGGEIGGREKIVLETDGYEGLEGLLGTDGLEGLLRIDGLEDKTVSERLEGREGLEGSLSIDGLEEKIAFEEMECESLEMLGFGRERTLETLVGGLIISLDRFVCVTFDTAKAEIAGIVTTTDGTLIAGSYAYLDNSKIFGAGATAFCDVTGAYFPP